MKVVQKIKGLGRLRDKTSEKTTRPTPAAAATPTVVGTKLPASCNSNDFRQVSPQFFLTTFSDTYFTGMKSSKFNIITV